MSRIIARLMLGAFLWIGVVGCETAGETAAVTEQPAEAMAEPTMESRVLFETAGNVLAEAVIARQHAGEPLPEDYQTPEFVLSTLEILRLQHPQAFAVTAEQERRFEAGRFDDRANTRRVQEALRQIERREVALGTVGEYLAGQYRQGALSGAPLELAARLLSARLRTAMAAG